MAGDITGANAVFFLSITSLFPVPIQLQGFAVDDIFNSQPLESVETMMGADGDLAAGFVFVAPKTEIMLMASSPSIGLFDAWWGAMQAQRTAFRANGNIQLPALGTKWALVNGALTSYQPIPKTGKLVQPRRFEITWESVSPAVD